MDRHPEYMYRLIAAYNIGFSNPHIKKVMGETDTGCLVTWNTEAAGPKTLIGPGWANDGFCINPLNWKTDGTPAPISANLGSVEVGKDE